MAPVLINERVGKIKNDENEINRFVEEYKPFIASCVGKSTGRYVQYGEDDELSIGLMAFVEAIKAYDALKGNFLAFARTVIKRRLIDYGRRENRLNNAISLETFAEEDEEGTDLSAHEALERYSEEEISEYRRLEIAELKKELAKWDISFVELADASPKQEKTREIYRELVRFMLSRPDLTDILWEKRYLPIQEIEKETRVPRKKIERGRKYIIAVLIIITGDYQYIKDFVDWGVSK